MTLGVFLSESGSESLADDNGGLMQIPPHLTSSVQSGKVVLVLGAGASVGALTPNGESAPDGRTLAELLANEFLGGEHVDDPLPIVAELAISESDLASVQEFIRSFFIDLQPASFHELLPTFRWAGLATTNYDLVIERAYEQCRQRSQEAVPFIKNGDRVRDKLQSRKSLMLLKLHGCISRTSDSDIPLILSTDQYLTHRNGRNRVFELLKDLSYECPLVFVGHSLRDEDIRQLLYELGDSDQRPRYYTVTPSPSEPERRYWESRRISTLKGTFEEFLIALDEQISTPFRGIVPAPMEDSLPISERFIVQDPGLSPRCLAFLENDVDYVRIGMQMSDLTPQLFYRGFNPRWSAIEKDLDVRRDIEDAILVDAVLDERENENGRLHMIRAHAGSGKSVLLQRVAWQAAIASKKLCLYLRPDGQLSFDAIRELSRVTNERIFLFVDDIDEHVLQVLDLIENSQRYSIALTVIGTARINEWNMSCEELKPFVLQDFELKYLSSREIDSLLDLLERHRSLFRLENASRPERRAAFVQRAGRQLLVALHEATLGKPFEDIVSDEFSAVRPDEARLLYLGVCFLNQFDVAVRAGIVNRVYGVRFTDFTEQFFQPLEGLVFTEYDRFSRDYAYITRHPHIAELVVARALSDHHEKLDAYLQMINSMNIDYESDRRAFRKLLRGRSLLEEFSDHQMIETIYRNARLKAQDSAYLLHQMGIYEMNRPDGNLQVASQHLNQAKVLAPNDRTIVHSLAELQLRRAERAGTTPEFHSLIDEAQSLARSLTGTNAVVSHGFHTLAKVYMAKLSKMQGQEESTDAAITHAIRDVEKVLQEGLQRFPNDPYLLAAESQMGELLSDDIRVMNALKAAFEKNPNNAYIVLRLTKNLLRDGQLEEVRSVYKRALEAGVVDKNIHFNYAKHLIDTGDGNNTDIQYHLRRAFTDGDRNFEAQFWYARQLYINGSLEDSESRFRQLRNSRGDPNEKRRVRGEIVENNQLRMFSGNISYLGADYGFVDRDGSADRVFLHPNNMEPLVWSNLERGSRIRFAIGFNYWGATATKVEFESPLKHTTQA